MSLNQVERTVRDTVAREPFGAIGERIGGHRFPPDARQLMSDTERIKALEDAVRALHNGLMKIARNVD